MSFTVARLSIAGMAPPHRRLKAVGDVRMRAIAQPFCCPAWLPAMLSPVDADYYHELRWRPASLSAAGWAAADYR